MITNTARILLDDYEEKGATVAGQCVKNGLTVPAMVEWMADFHELTSDQELQNLRVVMALWGQLAPDIRAKIAVAVHAGTGRSTQSGTKSLAPKGFGVLVPFNTPEGAA